MILISRVTSAPDSIVRRAPGATALAQMAIAPALDLGRYALPVAGRVAVARGGVVLLKRAAGEEAAANRAALLARVKAPSIYGAQETGLERYKRLTPTPNGLRGTFTAIAEIRR